MELTFSEFNEFKNLINHWGKFCGVMVGYWSLTQEVAGLNHFTVHNDKYFSH